jgi:GR25 family glycosyltransferase involved in LPS biosynthesis
MKFQSYLVCWDDYYQNCLDIESQFNSAGFEITVINSGTPRDGWQNLGDIRYYRQFYHALKNFNFENDYMLFMCGDISFYNWNIVIERAVEVLSKYDNIYLYAPHFTNDPWNFNSNNLKICNKDKDLSISSNTNGIMFFMHKEIVKDMLDFFDYFQEKHGWEGMVSGWAIDLVHSSFAIGKGKVVLRDSKNIITHPSGSSYNHGKATHETNLIFKSFNEFAPEYSGIVNKIYARMSNDNKFMEVQPFYGKDIDLIKKIDPINYHIIYINDERISNRNAIDQYLNGKKHTIKSLNAKDENLKQDFFNSNQDFKLSWEGFKIGEFGNFASHYLAWKYVAENNLDKLLVFEDDAKLDESFIDKYNLFLDFCPKDYDIFSIFVHENQFPRFNQNDIINEYISKGYQDWSTLCYVVSNSGAKKLLKYVKEIGMDYPTDWFIFRHGAKDIFKVYTFPPQIAGGVKIDDQYQSQVQ